MSIAKLSGLMGQLGHGSVSGMHSVADGELLTHFVATRDEEAFTELVRRHSGLVFGVCRRVTGNHHLAEDAFQAVFVVLATKATAVRPPSAVAAWLHGVAWRTAMRARTMAHRRQRREAVVPVLSEPTPPSIEEMPDAVALLDEEIYCLPEHYRLPLVLCELEGQTRKDVAGTLGIPEGTLSSRLATARKRLADRLRQRGIALSVAALTMALARAASARPVSALVAKAALAVTRELIPAPVATLSQGVLRIMFLNKLKTAIPLAIVAAGILACATVAAVPPPTPTPPPRVLATTPLLFVATHTDPPPARVEPKPLPKGPNKLLFIKSGYLTMIDPDGKNEKKVVEMGGFPPGMGGFETWRLSPDGKKLVVMCIPFEPGAGPGKLFIKELTEKGSWTDLEIVCETIAWSPDGNQIAATDCTVDPDKQRITTHHLIDVNTKEKKILKLPDNQMITDWTPDGKYVLTYSTVLKDDKRIYRLHLMNLDGTEYKVLTDEKQNAGVGRISPDGTRVLYATPVTQPSKEKPARPRSEMLVLDIATGKTTPVADLPLNGGVQSGICWSQDGKQIAYTWRQIHEMKPDETSKQRFRKETESHLIVCDVDGKNQKTIASVKSPFSSLIVLFGVDWR